MPCTLQRFTVSSFQDRSCGCTYGSFIRRSVSLMMRLGRAIAMTGCKFVGQIQLEALGGRCGGQFDALGAVVRSFVMFALAEAVTRR